MARAFRVPSADAGSIVVDEGGSVSMTGVWSDPGLDVVTLTSSSGVVVKNADGSATLTFPGGAAVKYTYSGSDLASVTDLSTGRVWSYTHNGKHDLLTARSPLEQGGNPLVEHEYTYDSSNRTDFIRTWLPAPVGFTRDKIETLFNDLMLPTQVTALLQYVPLGDAPQPPFPSQVPDLQVAMS